MERFISDILALMTEFMIKETTMIVIIWVGAFPLLGTARSMPLVIVILFEHSLHPTLQAY